MLSVEQKMVIYCNKTFVVPEQKTVDNRCFMCLQKWNRSLVKMLTGQALDLRAGQHEKGSLNSNLWNEIVEARQNKANELLQDAIANEAEDGKEEVKKRKKSQPLRASSKHSVLLPVSMEVEVQGHKLRLLLEGVGKQTIWIEFTEDNIRWLQAQVQGSEAVPRKARRKTSRSSGPARGASSEAEDAAEDDR